MKLFSALAGAICYATFAAAQSAVTVHDSAQNVSYVGFAYQGVEQYQNIRFGQDTSGPNRFKHAKLFTYPSGTTVQATAGGASCPQATLQTLAGFTTNPGVYEISEDCLNLRIARPAGTKAGAKLPVMVWFYGGGDETGSANYSLYEPTNLVSGAADKGTPLVYVAINYRLNIFGFASSPALKNEKSLNTGLLDQRLALQWISQYIAAFGGDPKSVTLFGQSSGGNGIGQQLTSYGGKGNPYFHRAIMESGSPSGDPGITSDFPQNSTATVAGLVNCKGNSGQVLACLRKVPMQKLLSAFLTFRNTTTVGEVFFPTIDNDFLPAAPSRLLASGSFHKNISVISGWTVDDGSIFTPPTLHDDAGVDAFIKLSYAGFNATTRRFVSSLYPVADFTAEAQTKKISPYFLKAAQIYRDLNFACPNIDVARHVSRTGSSSWVYELNTTSLEALLTLANATFLGVIHVSDVPFVFNHANVGLGITPAQNVTQRRMSGSWAQFVDNGNPNGNVGDHLTPWQKAFPDGFNGKITNMHIRVIDGPGAGLQTLSATGPGPQLLERCAKIFMQEGWRQFGA